MSTSLNQVSINDAVESIIRRIRPLIQEEVSRLLLSAQPQLQVVPTVVSAPDAEDLLPAGIQFSETTFVPPNDEEDYSYQPELQKPAPVKQLPSVVKKTAPVVALKAYRSNLVGQVLRFYIPNADWVKRHKAWQECFKVNKISHIVTPGEVNNYKILTLTFSDLAAYTSKFESFPEKGFLEGGDVKLPTKQREQTEVKKAPYLLDPTSAIYDVQLNTVCLTFEANHYRIHQADILDGIEGTPVVKRQGADFELTILATMTNLAMLHNHQVAVTVIEPKAEATTEAPRLVLEPNDNQPTQSEFVMPVARNAEPVSDLAEHNLLTAVDDMPTEGSREQIKQMLIEKVSYILCRAKVKAAAVKELVEACGHDYRNMKQGGHVLALFLIAGKIDISDLEGVYTSKVIKKVDNLLF